MSEPTYQRVVITGANRGIGLEFTRRFAPDSSELIACCRNPDDADELQSLADSHGGIRIQKLDVTRDDEVDDLADALDGGAVDVLINNAGVYGPRGQGVPPDPEAWMHTLRVNALAPLRLAGRLLDNVASSERKVIANVTSKMGSLGDNSSGGSYIYRTSKAALNAGMRSLAQDQKERGVYVLLLHPGWVQTDMGGENALIDVETSVRGMKELIDGAGPQLSGRFLNYDGTEIPW